MPTFSLIIPVYNVEQYLPRCLNSVMAQTYKDFECILIDDGTPDRSGEICDEYAARDERFKVIHQKNQGVSAARNAGLNAAVGKFIAFCDSDDELDCQYISALDSVPDDYGFVAMGVVNREVDNITVQYGVKTADESIVSIDETEALKFIERRSINTNDSKRYRKAIIDQYSIRFHDNISLGEDTLFNAEYFIRCNNIRYLPYYYYYYWRREGSLTAVNERFLDRLLESNNLIIEALCERFPNIQNAEVWKRRVWNAYYYFVWTIIRDHRLPILRKYNILNDIMNRTEYRQYCSEIDLYMASDSRVVRWAMSRKNSIWVISLYYVIVVRRRFRNER